MHKQSRTGPISSEKCFYHLLETNIFWEKLRKVEYHENLGFHVWIDAFTLEIKILKFSVWFHWKC